MSRVGGGLHDDDMPEKRFLKPEPSWRKEAREILFIVMLGMLALLAARVMPMVVVLLFSHAAAIGLGGFLGFKARDNEKFDNLRRRS